MPKKPQSNEPQDKNLKENPNEGKERPALHDTVGATSGIPIIGLAGSAGSLESFKNFFSGMPADSGAAFVIIQHLSPAHKSMLAEILAHQTRMPVREAREGMAIEENSVYVIPRNQYLGIRDGVLYLTEPVTEHGIRLPIDFFFRSVAEDRQERAICILFSGAGSDGALGIRAVRGAGGLTIAQDDTAQFSDMPRSAVATGMVDLVLRPDQMPKVVSEYLQQPYIRGGGRLHRRCRPKARMTVSMKSSTWCGPRQALTSGAIRRARYYDESTAGWGCITSRISHNIAACFGRMPARLFSCIGTCSLT